MRVIFQFIVLILGTKEIASDGSESLYKSRSYSMEKWPKTIYKEIVVQVGSKIECTALCQIESSSCVGIVWDGSICYLADPRSQFSVIPSPQTMDQQMLINLGICNYSKVRNAFW